MFDFLLLIFFSNVVLLGGGYCHLHGTRLVFLSSLANQNRNSQTILFHFRTILLVSSGR
jgi:hypothetical protein